jgi:hypothetical protein
VACVPSQLCPRLQASDGILELMSQVVIPASKGERQGSATLPSRAGTRIRLMWIATLTGWVVTTILAGIAFNVLFEDPGEDDRLQQYFAAAAYTPPWGAYFPFQRSRSGFRSALAPTGLWRDSVWLQYLEHSAAWSQASSSRWFCSVAQRPCLAQDSSPFRSDLER